ncbi:MAG: CARDB domain-containing protein [Candidatus Zixiibacteriota bacterium]
MLDTKALSGYDYWGKLHYTVGRVNSGDSSAWCAAVGDMPDGWAYDNNMEAQMFTSSGVNVSQYTNLELTYYVWYNTENTFDFLFDYYSFDGINWYLAYEYTGPSFGWLFVSDFIPDTIWYYQKFVFSSDGAINDYEGAYLDDITITGDPIARPNLTYGTPPGWTGPIVPSSVQNTHTVNTLYTNQPTYIDFAIRNTGHSTTESFYTDLYIDGTWVEDFFTSGLDSNEWILVSDVPHTVTSSGVHYLEIRIDPLFNWVVETNEDDNTFTANFSWVNPPTVPNLTFTIPPFWDGPIVPSGVPGSHAIGGLYANQPTYIDWAVENNGNGNAGTFSTRLLIDGVQVQTVIISSLAAGNNYQSNDFTYTLTSGNHILRLEIDYLNQVTETDPNDNNLNQTFNWSTAYIIAEGEVLYRKMPSTLSILADSFKIELWDFDSIGPGQLLDSSYTTAWGEFTLGPVSNSEEGGSRQDIYVRAYSQNYASIVGDVKQVFSPYSVFPFGMCSDTVQNVTSGSYRFGFPSFSPSLVADSIESEFFYIADVIREGLDNWFFYRSSDDPGITKVFLHEGNNTAYDRTEDVIKINPDTGNRGPDAFDKDIILHEFGHRLQYRLGFIDASSGGPSSWTGIQSLELAASEGFATFWSAVTRNDSFYRDSYNFFRDTAWLNLENGIRGRSGTSNQIISTANTLGKLNIGAICGMLWDIYDNNASPEDFSDSTTWYDGSGPVDSTDTLISYHHSDNIKDTLSLPADSILEVLFKNTYSGHKPDNINDFWESWFLPPSQNHVEAMLDIWYEHGDDSLICIGLRGDVNSDGIYDVNILDQTYLVDRIFRGGPRSPRPLEADVNGSGGIPNVVDLTFIIDRLFRGGPPPPPCP